MEALKVHYGCGLKAPPGWLNFDASPTLRFERVPVIGKLYSRNGARFPHNVRHGDITKGLPVPDGSAAVAYASHVLEHLSLADFRAALRNTYRILKPGGVFRLVVPDLKALALRYVETGDAVKFIEESGMGAATRPGILRLGNSAHLWLWDYEALEKELTAVGFSHIRRCQFGDSSLPCFAEVEEAERFVDAVAVECRR